MPRGARAGAALARGRAGAGGAGGAHRRAVRGAGLVRVGMGRAGAGQGAVRAGPGRADHARWRAGAWCGLAGAVAARPPGRGGGLRRQSIAGAGADRLTGVRLVGAVSGAIRAGGLGVVSRRSRTRPHCRRARGDGSLDGGCRRAGRGAGWLAAAGPAAALRPFGRANGGDGRGGCRAQRGRPASARQSAARGRGGARGAGRSARTTAGGASGAGGRCGGARPWRRRGYAGLSGGGAGEPAGAGGAARDRRRHGRSGAGRRAGRDARTHQPAAAWRPPGVPGGGQCWDPRGRDARRGAAEQRHAGAAGLARAVAPFGLFRAGDRLGDAAVQRGDDRQLPRPGRRQCGRCRRCCGRGPG